MTSNDGEARAVAVAPRDVRTAVEAILLHQGDAGPELLASLAGGNTARDLLACASSLGVNLSENRQALRLLCLAGMT